MDPALKALCGELLAGDVNSERFAWLLIETGVVTQGFEWDLATKLIGQSELSVRMAKDEQMAVH